MKAVLVTTKHRGVFFGELKDTADETATTLALSNVRNAIYWHADTGGFLGLAQDGPAKGSRIGKTATGPITLHDITSVTRCSDKAAKVWREWE